MSDSTPQPNPQTPETNQAPDLMIPQSPPLSEQKIEETDTPKCKPLRSVLKPHDLGVEISFKITSASGVQIEKTDNYVICKALASANVQYAMEQFGRRFHISKDEIYTEVLYYFTENIKASDNQIRQVIADSADQFIDGDTRQLPKAWT
jgi:hypothetical protein